LYDLLDIAATDMTTKAEKKRMCAEDFVEVHEIIRNNKATAKRMRKNGTLITLTFKKSEWERHVVAFEEEKEKETDAELLRIKKR
jgi:ribosomal 50S subunit-recycling heat shock protein